MPRILLVEDDQNASEVFQLCLEGNGHVVVTCNDTCSAMAAIGAKNPIDIAFVDYWLAKETAESVLKFLSTTYPDLPVVLISGGSKSVSVETTKWLGAIDGAQGFLQKPFSVHDVEAMIARLI